MGCTYIGIQKFYTMIVDRSISKQDKICAGLKLDKLVEVLNDAIGPCLFVDFALVLVSLTFSLFLSFISFTSYK